MKELDQSLIKITEVQKVARVDDSPQKDDDTFTINIVNMCNWQITKLITKEGQIFNYSPPIGRTCPTNDFELCKKNNSYAVLLTTRCGGPTVEFTIHMHHPAGWEADSGMVSVTPDCNYLGTIMGVDVPDPHK